MHLVILRLHVLFRVIVSGRRIVAEHHRSVSLDALSRSD